MPTSHNRSLISLPTLSSLFPKFPHWHFDAAAARLLASSLFSVVIITGVLVLKSLIVLVASLGPMSTKSKIPMAATSPTRSPDKANSHSLPRGLPSREPKRSFDSLGSPELKPTDGQQTEEQFNKGRRFEFLPPSSSKAVTLRRSSQRIPDRQQDRIVPFLVPKDMPAPSQAALLDTAGFVPHPVTEQNGAASSATETSQASDSESEEPRSGRPASVIGTTPDPPESSRDNARPLVNRSGCLTRMDTISEHSAESESSNKGEARPPDGEANKAPDRPSLPATDAIVERPSNDALSLNSDFKAVQTYMYGDDRDILSKSTSERSPGSPCRSIDGVLSESIMSASSGEAQSVQDGPKTDLQATPTRAPLPDNMIETPQSNSASSVLEKCAAADQEDKDDYHTEEMNRISQFLGEEGKETRKNMLFDVGDSPSPFQVQRPDGFDAAKLDLPRPSRPASGHWMRGSTIQDNYLLESPLPMVRGDRPLGETSDRSMSSCTEHGPRPPRTRDEDERADDDDIKQAAGHQVDPSRAASLTKSLVSAMHHGPDPQTLAQSKEEDSSCMDIHDAIMTLITNYRQEEDKFWPLLVSVTCHERAAPAAGWIFHSQRRIFKRLQDPILSFGHQIGRYCLYYIPGFDLKEAVRKLQVSRERGGAGSNLVGKRGPTREPTREPPATGWKRPLLPGRVGTGPGAKRVVGVNVGYRSLLDIDIPRACGCGTGSTQCRHAESSSHGSLRTSSTSWEMSSGADDNKNNSNSNSNSSYRPNGGFRGDNELHVAGDKGKGVDRWPETRPLEVVGDINSASLKAERGRGSPQTGCPPSPTKSSTVATASRSNFTSTTGTPSTPRTALSCPSPEDKSRRPSPRPLTETGGLEIQDALRNAAETIVSLHVFLVRLREAWHAAHPGPASQFRQGYPSSFATYQHAGLAPAYGDYVIRTQAHRDALARWTELVRSCYNRVEAAVFVLDKETKAIKTILDAADPLHLKAEPELAREKPAKPSYFTSLLRKATSQGMRGDGELKMTGGLPATDELHEQSGAATSEDKHDGADEPHRRASSKLAESHSVKDDDDRNSSVQRQTNANEHGPTTPSLTGVKANTSPILEQRQSRNSPKACPKLPVLRLSLAGLRARYAILVQMAKLASLDTYNYRYATFFGEGLDQFEEKLWALESQRQNSVSSGASAKSGSRSSSKAGFTDPWTKAKVAPHQSGRRAFPWRSAASSSASSPRSQPNPSLNSGGSSHSKTQASDNSTKKNDAGGIVSKDKWIEDTRNSIRQMRRSVATMIQTIIARRPGTIGIVDTEERLPLKPEEWNEVDITISVVKDGGPSRTHPVSNGAGEEAATLRVRHSPGCRHGHDGEASNRDIQSKPWHGDAGIGLGIVNSRDGTDADLVGARSGKKLALEKAHAYASRNPRRESSTTSIPLDVGSPTPAQCPGCGVDLVQSAPQISKNKAPRSLGGPSQIGWVRKVIGPLGRKRAGLYSVYPHSFGTQPLNHARGEEQMRNQDEQSLEAPSPDCRPRDTPDHVEEDSECDGDDDSSVSSREQRGRQARRRSVSEPLLETSYDRRTGRGEGLALLRSGKTGPAQKLAKLPEIPDRRLDHGIGVEKDFRAAQSQDRQARNVEVGRRIKFDDATCLGRRRHGQGHRFSAGMGQTSHGGHDESGLGLTPRPSRDSGCRTGSFDSGRTAGKFTYSNEYESGMDSESEPLLARMGRVVQIRDRSKTM